MLHDDITGMTWQFMMMSTGWWGRCYSWPAHCGGRHSTKEAGYRKEWPCDLQLPANHSSSLEVIRLLKTCQEPTRLSYVIVSMETQEHRGGFFMFMHGITKTLEHKLHRRKTLNQPVKSWKRENKRTWDQQTWQHVRAWKYVRPCQTVRTWECCLKLQNKDS